MSSFFGINGFFIINQAFMEFLLDQIKTVWGSNRLLKIGINFSMTL